MTVSKARQAEIDARRARVLTFRASGMTWEQVATTVGLPSAQHAVMDAKRALASRRAQLAELADYFVALEVERLDRLEAAVQTVLGHAQRGGDQWMVLRAVDRSTRLSYRRGMLLGFDAVTPTGGDRGEGPADVVDEIAARRARRRAAAHR